MNVMLSVSTVLFFVFFLYQQTQPSHGQVQEAYGYMSVYSASPRTWIEAEAHCNSRSAELASIHNAEQFVNLNNLMDMANGNECRNKTFWMGGQEEPEDSDNFVWSDGTEWWDNNSTLWKDELSYNGTDCVRVDPDFEHIHDWSCQATKECFACGDGHSTQNPTSSPTRFAVFYVFDVALYIRIRYTI